MNYFGFFIKNQLYGWSPQFHTCSIDLYVYPHANTIVLITIALQSENQVMESSNFIVLFKKQFGYSVIYIST